VGVIKVKGSGFKVQGWKIGPVQLLNSPAPIEFEIDIKSMKCIRKNNKGLSLQSNSYSLSENPSEGSNNSEGLTLNLEPLTLNLP